MINIEYETMKKRLNEILIGRAVPADLADRISTVMTDNTCDGVASHGINRFVKMLEYVDDGYIDPEARPEVISIFGAMEVVDGHLGFGVTNAWYSMERSVRLATQYGIGCTAIRNTNHWMRGATYGLQAAAQGLIGICFTNTLPNMPAWGAQSSRIGNNPLIVAIPNGARPVVLDMAMSQFSYGKMETLALDDLPLPMDGGYDMDGKLTKAPEAILESGRILPTGYWKGSGLSIVLDLMASVLSGGLNTREIGERPVENAVSQVFIAIEPGQNAEIGAIEEKVTATLEYIKASEKIDGISEIYYPGERSQNRREENLKNGIPVNESVWEKIMEL